MFPRSTTTVVRVHVDSSCPAHGSDVAAAALHCKSFSRTASLALSVVASGAPPPSTVESRYRTLKVSWNYRSVSSLTQESSDSSEALASSGFQYLQNHQYQNGFQYLPNLLNLHQTNPTLQCSTPDDPDEAMGRRAFGGPRLRHQPEFLDLTPSDQQPAKINGVAGSSALVAAWVFVQFFELRTPFACSRTLNRVCLWLWGCSPKRIKLFIIIPKPAASVHGGCFKCALAQIFFLLCGIRQTDATRMIARVEGPVMDCT